MCGMQVEAVGRSAGSRTVRAILWVEALCAIFGYIGGIMFFVDLGGKSFWMDPKLKSLPVSDFLLVGVWLFVVEGVGFSFVTYAVWNRNHGAGSAPSAFPLFGSSRRSVSAPLDSRYLFSKSSSCPVIPRYQFLPASEHASRIYEPGRWRT